MRLGIDFGTCYSSAALLLDNTLKPIKEPLKHGYSFPSSVFLTPEGEMLVGFAAENRRLKDIQRYKNEFKRVLGKPEPLFLGDRQLQPDELVTEVIARLKTEADKVVTGRGERSLSQAILTVPATYLSNKRQLMLQACDRAGFSQVKLLEEPVAAAIYYSNTAKIAEGDIILVYDLGGGTFDVTLLQKQNSGYQIRGMPDGDPNCGGVDFDRFIFRELLKNCSEELRQKLIPKECRQERAFVLPMCRNLKHQLSEASEAEISIPLTMESFSLTRERFNELIDDLVSKTVTCCDRLISSAELEWSQINRVLLVGGSCRIPYVREVIARKWGKTPSQIDDPELAVCLGAAIYGTELDSESPESYLQKGLAKIQAGDYQSAIAEFNRAIELDSNYAPAYCHRGLAHAQLNEDQSALEDYNLAIHLDRNYGEAYLHRGNLRCQSNDLKGAIEDYDRAIFVNPDLTEAAEKKELVFERLISISQPQVTNSTVSADETVKADEQEVNLESSDPVVMPGQDANHVVEVISIDNSVPDNTTVILNDPARPEGQVMRVPAEEFIDAWEDSGQYDGDQQTVQDNSESELEAQKYRTIAKELAAKELLDRGDALYNQGHLEKAISNYQESIRLDPSNSVAHHNLGSALYDQGYLEEAISEYQKALNLNPNWDVVSSHLEAAEIELKQRTSSESEIEEVQIKPKTSTYNPDLPSEWGADYRKLRDLLAAGNWKEADLETKAIFKKFGGLFNPSVTKELRNLTGGLVGGTMLLNPLLAVAGGLGVGHLYFKAFSNALMKVNNIPQTDISTVDRLWVEYSNGHFGFSVQEQIFTQVEKKEGDFGDRVGWRTGVVWKKHNQLTFSLNAPQGHLPSLPWWSEGGLGNLCRAFYSRVKNCQLNEQNNGSLDSNDADN